MYRYCTVHSTVGIHKYMYTLFHDGVQNIGITVQMTNTVYLTFDKYVQYDMYNLYSDFSYNIERCDMLYFIGTV